MLDDSSIAHSQSLDESFSLLGPPQVTTSPLVGQAFAGPLSPAKVQYILLFLFYFFVVGTRDAQGVEVAVLL